MLSSHSSGELVPARTRCSPAVTGASIPWRSKANPSRGTVAIESAGAPGSASSVAARPAKVSLRPPLARASLVDLGEDPPRGRVCRVRSARGGGRRGERGRALGAGRELRAGDVVGGVNRQASRSEDVSELAPEVGIACGQRHRAARVGHDRKARWNRQRGDRASVHPLGHVSRGRRAQRRNEPGPGHEHRRALAHAPAELTDDSRQARTGHRENNQVHSGGLDFWHRLRLDRLAPRAVPPPRPQALGLVLGEAAELHLEPGPRQHGRDCRAHATRADDRRRAQRWQTAEPLPLQLDARPDPLGHLPRQER